MEVPLPGRKGSLTLLSSIRAIIGTVIRALCEILMAAPSEHQSFYIQHKILPCSTG